jgi:hypothetical protein
LPESIIPVLARALRKHPDSRYPDIETFAADLHAATHNEKPAVAEVMPAEKRNGPTPNDTLILSEQPALFAPTTLEASKTIIQQKLWQWGGVVAGVTLILGLVLGLAWLSGQSSTSDITLTPAGGGNGGASSGSVTAPAAIRDETEEVTATQTSTLAPTETTEPTVTDTLTHTASPTETATIMPSDTPAPTSTQTAILTQTSTLTRTPSPTLTNTRRPSQTPTEAVTAVLATASACEVADLNDNGEVDIFDLRAISAIFGTVQGDEGYNENYDFDNNEIINILDLRRVSSQYGTSC